MSLTIIRNIHGLFLGKVKKVLQLLMFFKQILNEPEHTPHKIWVDKNSKFYNNSLKSWLQDNDMEMYSTHKKNKFVITEKIIRTLKNMYLYIDKLADITNKYNNKYHRTITMIPDDVNSSTYIDFDIENNNLILFRFDDIFIFQN